MLLIRRCSSKEPSIAALLEKLATLEKKERISLQILSPHAVYSPLCIQAAIEMNAKNSPARPKTALETGAKNALPPKKAALEMNAKNAPACQKAANAEKNSLLTSISLTQNFSSALKIAGAKDPRDFILAAWGKKVSWEKIASALSLKQLAWGKKDAHSFAKFYGISKQALKIYPLENLIVEKMALSKL